MMLCKVSLSLIFIVTLHVAESSVSNSSIQVRSASFYGELEDLIINTNVLSRENDVSLIKCLRHCINLESCVSFFHNYQGKICQIHSTIFEGFFSATQENGWKYYLLNGCPNGWIENMQSCYLFNDKSSETWLDAQFYCTGKGGTLAVITSQEEEDFIVSTALSLNESSRAAPDVYGFWLGGSDLAVEGAWVWAASGENLTYTDWEPGEPNQWGGLEEDCLASFGPFNYKWGDLPCTATLNPICERGLLN